MADKGNGRNSEVSRLQGNLLHTKNNGWAKWGGRVVPRCRLVPCHEGKAGWKEEGAENEPREGRMDREVWLGIPAPRIPGHGRTDT